MVGSNDTGGTYAKLVRLARLPRLYRLFRILRICKGMKQSCGRKCTEKLRSMRSNSGMTRMCSVLVYVMIALHIISCLWVMTSKIDDVHPDTWLARTESIDSSAADQYLLSIYWAFQTVTTVGFGDIPAVTVSQRILALFWMIFGVGFYSFTVGSLSSIIADMDAKNADIRQKVDSFLDFSRKVKLNYGLVDRVVNHFQNSSKKVSLLNNQADMISGLPSALRAQIVKETHAQIIHKLKILQGKSTEFVWMFLHMLEPQHLSQNQDLYLYEEYAEDVYFVFTGKIILKNVDGLPFVRFLTGSMFGEVEILFETLRYCSAAAQVVSNLLFINKKNFQALLESFPKVRIQLRKIARQKAERHEEAMKIVVEGGHILKQAMTQFAQSEIQSVAQPRTKKGSIISEDKHQLQRLSTLVISECGESRKQIQRARTGNQPGVSQLFDYSMKAEEMKSEVVLRNDESLDRSQNKHISRILDGRASQARQSSKNVSRELQFWKPKVSLKKDEDYIKKFAKQQLQKAESMSIKIEEDSFLRDFKLTKSKVSKHESSNLGAILKEESKLVLAEREGKLLRDEESERARKDMLKIVKPLDFYSTTVPQKRAILEECPEISEKEGDNQSRMSSPLPPHIIYLPPEQRIRTESRFKIRMEEIKSNEFKPEQVLGAFNETMGLLQEKCTDIMGIFNRLGAQHESIVSEIKSMKGILKEYSEKEALRHSDKKEEDP